MRATAPQCLRWTKGAKTCVRDETDGSMGLVCSAELVVDRACSCCRSRQTMLPETEYREAISLLAAVLKRSAAEEDEATRQLLLRVLDKQSEDPQAILAVELERALPL